MMNELKDFVILLGIFGIPSIFTMTCWCINQCRGFGKQFNIVMRALKAQMRSQLLKDYEYYMTRGWISNVELEEWQNQFSAYHELVGPNGVLDDRYEKLLTLPNNSQN